MNEGRRFKQVLDLIKDKTGKNLKRICKELNISYSMLSLFNTNRHQPTQDLLDKAERIYNINKDYILKGTGEPFLSEAVEDVATEHKNTAKQILDYLAEIPVYETPAYANQGTVLPLDYYQTGDKLFKMKFPVKNAETLGALKVSGKSLTDLAIMEDDYVLFDSAITPKDGDLVVAQLNGELLVKVYKDNGEVEFHSKDGKTKPIKKEVDDICKIIGRVIGVHREI